MIGTLTRRRLALTAMAAALLAGPAAAADITLTFANWASAETTTRPGIEHVIAEFEKANPGIKIDSQAIAFSQIGRQLVLRVRSGNPPDVAQIAGNDTFLLAASGGLQPLDQYAAGTLKTLKPGSYAPFKTAKGLIAMPWNQAPAGLWFNRDILKSAGIDQPPTTIKELNADMAKIKAADPKIIVMGLDTTNRAFSLQSNWPWMKAFGAVPIGPGATGADTPQMKAYLSWMRMLAKKGYIDPGRKIGEFRPLMAQGQVGFLWDQVLVQGVIQTAGKFDQKTFDAKFGVEAMPTGPSGKGYSFEGGHQLVMFAKSKHKAAAWKFIKYLATNEAAAKSYTVGSNRSIPPAAHFSDPALAASLDTPVIKAFSSKIIPTITPEPFGPQFASAATAIMAGVQEAVTSDKPIDQIAANIQSQLKN